MKNRNDFTYRRLFGTILIMAAIYLIPGVVWANQPMLVDIKVPEGVTVQTGGDTIPLVVTFYVQGTV